MGNQTASTTVISDVLNKTATNIMTEMASKCTQDNSASNTILLKDIDAGDCSLDISDIEQSILLKPRFVCEASNKSEGEMLNRFKSDLETSAKNKLEGLSGAFNSESATNVINKLVNDISTNLNLRQLSECVQQNEANNTLEIINAKGCPTWCGNPAECSVPLVEAGLSDNLVKSICNPELCRTSVNNLTQNVTMETVATCMLKNTSVQDIVANAANELSNIAQTESKGIGFDLFGGLIGARISSIVLSVSIIISVIFIFIFFIMPMFAGGEEGGEVPMEVPVEAPEVIEVPVEASSPISD